MFIGWLLHGIRLWHRLQIVVDAMINQQCRSLSSRKDMLWLVSGSILQVGSYCAMLMIRNENCLYIYYLKHLMTSPLILYSKFVSFGGTDAECGQKMYGDWPLS